MTTWETLVSFFYVAVFTMTDHIAPTIVLLFKEKREIQIWEQRIEIQPALVIGSDIMSPNLELDNRYNLKDEERVFFFVEWELHNI